MIIVEKTVSVPEAANICGVTRSTINNWINTKKLYARRSGRNYSVPKKELLLFLKSAGRTIPPELKTHGIQKPVFKSFQHCWEYWADSDHGGQCKDCVVLNNRLRNCFTAKGSSRLYCTVGCSECRYYQDIYLPRIQFIDQIEFPAAVCHGLYFWGGNSKMAKVCEIPAGDFPGMGMERVIHPDSLEAVISNIKRLELEEPLPMTLDIFLKSASRQKIRATICLCPLSEPSGSFLMLLKPRGGK